MTPHPRDEPFGRTSQHGVLLRAAKGGDAAIAGYAFGMDVLRGDPARPHERGGRRAAACCQGWVVSAS
jgi:hypothetical protein